MKRDPSHATYAQNPRCCFCACDRKVLSLLEQTERLFIRLGQLAIQDFIKYCFIVLALVVGFGHSRNIS